MIANVKTRTKTKISRIEKIENEADILLAEQRLKNPESMKNQVPFEKVLEKFNITQQEIDNAEEVEFVKSK